MNDASHRAHLNSTTVRGRPFAAGNPGRRPGSKNRATLVAQALLDGGAEELVRKGLELAKSGDPSMLRFFLDRIVAKDRHLDIDLFLSDGDPDPVETSQRVFDAATRGEITPSEASALMTILEGHARIIKHVEYGERLEQIEKEVREIHKLTPKQSK
jgi:hypothetical protein